MVQQDEKWLLFVEKTRGGFKNILFGSVSRWVFWKGTKFIFNLFIKYGEMNVICFN
jgi:hypothetical protein